MDLWIGGGGPASTARDIDLVRRGGRGVDVEFVAKFLEGS